MFEEIARLVEELNKKMAESENQINEIKNIISNREEEKNKRMGIYGDNTEREIKELDEEIAAKYSELEGAQKQKNEYVSEIAKLNSYKIQYQNNPNEITKLTQSNNDLNKELAKLESEKNNLEGSSEYIKKKLQEDINKIKAEIERNNKAIEELKNKQAEINEYVNNKVNAYGLNNKKDEVKQKEDATEKKENEEEKTETADAIQEKKDETSEKIQEDKEEIKAVKDDIDELREKYKASREKANQYRKDGNEDAALLAENEAEQFLIQIDELKKKKSELQEKVVKAEEQQKDNNISSSVVEVKKEPQVVIPTNNNVKVTKNAQSKTDVKAILGKIRTFFTKAYNTIKTKIIQATKSLKTKFFTTNEVKAIGSANEIQNTTNEKSNAEFREKIKVGEDNIEKTNESKTDADKDKTVKKEMDDILER